MKRFLLALLVVALPACGDVDDDQAAVQMVNALADYQTLDLLVGDQMKIQDLPFGERSTGIRIGVKDRENEDPGGGSTSTTAAESTTTSTASTSTTDGSSTTTTTSTTTSTTTTTIPTGSRTLQVFVDAVATALIEQSVTLTAQRRYTFFAYQDGAGARLIVEEESKPNFNGHLKIRVAAMAPSSGTLDVYVLEEGQTIAGESPTGTNLTPGSVTAYVEVDPGTYDIVLAQAGTKTAVLSTGPVDYESGTLVTLVALDNAGGGLPLGSLLTVDRP